MKKQYTQKSMKLMCDLTLCMRQTHLQTIPLPPSYSLYIKYINTPIEKVQNLSSRGGFYGFLMFFVNPFSTWSCLMDVCEDIRRVLCFAGTDLGFQGEIQQQDAAKTS